MTDKPQSRKPLFILTILAVLFILSMFYRASNAVIVPNLMKDFGLDAESLGILGGAFFYSFALIQIPIGPLLDRIGPRWVITFFSMIGGLGAFLFGIGSTFTAILWGRILIGAGMASVLMGSLKVFALRFSPERFATLTGTFLSVGMVGTILASTPLAYFASLIGWRMTFIIAGVMTVILSFSVFWVLKEKNVGEEVKGATESSINQEIGLFQSLRLILGSFAFWQIAISAFFRYGTFMSLQGLWLGPYLINIKGYSPIEAGNSLIFLSIGWVVGGPLGGRLSERTFRSKKGLSLLGLSLYCLSLIPLTGIFKIQNSFWYFFIFFCLGFFNVIGAVIFSHAKELFPIRISGTVLTLVNFFSMCGAAFFMPVLGGMIESFQKTGQGYPEEAYHLSFFICVLSMAASVIFYAFPKKGKGEFKKGV